jgi:gamma-glutamylcyclotransferase (GGCT)/AIG2-like uncharacterized protein YtfP
MLYFSYGSFLDSETLKKHAPNAKYVKRAVLDDFEVQFNFLSKTYDGGVTGVEPAAGKKALGVLYNVPPDEMEKLDIVEGVPAGIYYRETITVVDENGNEHQAETYRTTNPKGPFTPTRRYLGLMINGAREHGLDPDYIKDLEDLYATLKK